MENKNTIIKLIGLLLDGDTPASPSSANPILSAGSKVLIRTVTYHHIGTVSENDGKFVTLKDCGWLADSGRFSECLNTGTVSEFESSPVNCCINLDSIIDAWPWNHSVPETK
jgi:hypothetical protein